jgi:hypothetical protein
MTSFVAITCPFPTGAQRRKVGPMLREGLKN